VRSRYVTHLGEEFVPVTIAAGGMKCRFCGGALKRGDKAAQFPHQPPHHRYECSPCVYAGFDGKTPPWKEGSDGSHRG
jgi:hypothetical protein